MAFGTLMMAAAVAYYNRKTLRQNQQQIQIMGERTKMDFEQMAIAHQQLDMLRRERERPQIVELLKFAVVPLLSQLTKELMALHKREYNWIHQSGKSHSMLMLKEAWWEEQEVMGDLMRKFPEIEELMDNHDKLVTSLNENLKALEGVIYTPEFVGKCKKAIETYDASCPKGSRVPESAIPEAPQIFVSYVVDNVVELPEANSYRDLWSEYANRFLEIREKEEVKNKISNVEKSAAELEEISLSLTEKLVELGNKLKEGYWITTGEIEADQVYGSPSEISG